VIGGGDWSPDRLVPDIVRGCLGPEESVILRSPNSVRPWQHVLEPLWGYLLLAQRLVDSADGFDEGWNFGPDNGQERAVIDVAKALVSALEQGRVLVAENDADRHEAKLLQLVSTKAQKLGWAPTLNPTETIEMTANWYKSWTAGGDAKQLCLAQIEQYMKKIGKIDE